MIYKIIGSVLVLIGLVISLSHKLILNKVIRVKKLTDIHIVKVKSVGLAFAIVGALIVFLLD